MKAFIDKYFLLENTTGEAIYKQYKTQIPLVDYDCHFCIDDIVSNKTYENLTQFYITNSPKRMQFLCDMQGRNIFADESISDYDIFAMYVDALEEQIGNPEYVLFHLFVQKFFGYHGPIRSADTEQIWEQCNRKLYYPNMCVRRMIEENNIHYLNIAQNLTDDLTPYKTLENEPLENTIVTPYIDLFAPDDESIQVLRSITGKSIQSFADYTAALEQRLAVFKESGCVSIKHCFDSYRYIPAEDITIQKADRLISTILNDGNLSEEEYNFYQNYMIYYLTSLCHTHNLVFMVDFIHTEVREIGTLLTTLSTQNEQSVPKMLVYTDGEYPVPLHNFMSQYEPNPLRSSSFQWQIHYDLNPGFIPQMPDMLKQQVIRSNFSKVMCISSGQSNFLNLAYNDIYRRYLCNTIGKLIEDGFYSKDFSFIENIVENICCNNAISFFLDSGN